MEERPNYYFVLNPRKGQELTHGTWVFQKGSDKWDVTSAYKVIPEGQLIPASYEIMGTIERSGDRWRYTPAEGLTMGQGINFYYSKESNAFFVVDNNAPWDIEGTSYDDAIEISSDNASIQAGDGNDRISLGETMLPFGAVPETIVLLS